jgi:hypothetical protein
VRTSSDGAAQYVLSQPLHLTNDSGYIVTPENGEMQQAQGCTPIPGSDPLIDAYRRVAG